MNYNQAVASIERGKKVRRGKVEIYGQAPVLYCNGIPWHPSKEDMRATDWILADGEAPAPRAAK
jgi:hypothetical protein